MNPAKDNAALDSESLIASELPNFADVDPRLGTERPQSEYSSPTSRDNEALQKLFSELDRWSFDIFKVDDDLLPDLVELIFKNLGLFDTFPMEKTKVRAFTRAMAARYQPNPYHNFRHACDVLHASYLILTITEAGKKFTHLEKLALALAALCHDVDHPGLTNAFLVATYDPLAIRYNDRGVLENHHAATCFVTMRAHDALNILDVFNEVEQRHIRKLMLTIILATDMEAHSRILHEMTDRLARPEPFEVSPAYTPPGSLSPLREEFSSFGSTPQGSPRTDQVSVGEGPDDLKEIKDTVIKVYKNPLQSALPITSSNDVLLLLQMVIKCADLSNVVKPFFLSKRWAALLLLEWFRQGEIERQLGLPISKFMDREDPTTLMAMTCGCIDYIAKPMYEATSKLLPKLQEEVLVNLSFNRQMWNQFSTNGRRASENTWGEFGMYDPDDRLLSEMRNNVTAQQILGVYAPPPLFKDINVIEPDEGALENWEDKLVASFNGQFVAAGARLPDKIDVELPSVGSTPLQEPGIEKIDISSSEGHQSYSLCKTSQIDIPSSGRASGESGADDVSNLQLTDDVESSNPKIDIAHSDIPEDRATLAMSEESAIQEGSTHSEHSEEIDVQSLGKAEHASHSERPIEGDGAPALDKSDFQIEKQDAGPLHIAQAGVSTPHPASVTDSISGENSPFSEARGEDIEPEPGTEEDILTPLVSEAPLSLLFGPSDEASLMLSRQSGRDGEPVSLVPGLLPAANFLIVDRNKRSIDAFRVPANVSAPTNVRPPSFKSGIIDGEKEKIIIIPQTEAPVGFWAAIRTHPRVTKLNKAMDSKVWNSVFIVATFFALFADDVVKGFLPKQADTYEAHVLIACLVLFLLEGVILSIFRDGYFISFFFWLDMLGSLSLIPLIIGISSQNLVLARTGRAAKAITRASKLLQASHIRSQIASFLPVARLLKLVGQYRDSSLDDSDYDEEEEHVSSKPSQLWTKLSELTTQKLILGVIIIIILFPYFGNTEKDLGPVVSLNGLDYYQLASLDFTSSFNHLLANSETHGYEIAYLGVRPSCLSPSGSPVSGCTGIDVAEEFVQLVPDPGMIPDGRQGARNKYRVTELISVTSDSYRAQAYYSIRKLSKLKYGMNIAMTVIVLSILALWCFFLSRDSNLLLIQPIERMVQFVKELAEDPVSFAGKTIAKPTGDKSKLMETFFVEEALVKIASLTKVALGDAGMDILSVNLKGAAFNPMLPGKKIRACFGFCDIRNFTDATECLQEDVMMFVNRIADVVHNKVVLHSGFPNKNIGDAFLIVWKKTVSDNTNKTRATSFADRALRSFLDIIQCIETSQSLAEFAKHPAIQRRMPGYRIHMGFGLHVGWAIEGAIGSAHKVDPSYLSPHVNMASRLEAATKQYGVMLLISETVIAHLTKSSLRDNCRKLDRVTVKGSREPLVLYTFDIPLFQQDLKANPAEYRDIFEEAVDSYIDGNWANSLEKLEECTYMWPTDKPIQVLLNFMASHNYTVPENWQGYRELTEK